MASIRVSVRWLAPSPNTVSAGKKCLVPQQHTSLAATLAVADEGLASKSPKVRCDNGMLVPAIDVPSVVSAVVEDLDRPRATAAGVSQEHRRAASGDSLRCRVTWQEPFWNPRPARRWALCERARPPTVQQRPRFSGRAGQRRWRHWMRRQSPDQIRECHERRGATHRAGLMTHRPYRHRTKQDALDVPAQRVTGRVARLEPKRRL